MLHNYGPLEISHLDGETIFKFSWGKSRYIFLWSPEDGCMYYPANLNLRAPIVRADDEMIEVIYRGKVIYSCPAGVDNLSNTILNNMPYYAKPWYSDDPAVGGLTDSYGSIYLRYRGCSMYIKKEGGVNGPFDAFEFGVLVNANFQPIYEHCTIKEMCEFIYKNRSEVSGVNQDLNYFRLGKYVFGV